MKHPIYYLVSLPNSSQEETGFSQEQHIILLPTFLHHLPEILTHTHLSWQLDIALKTRLPLTAWELSGCQTPHCSMKVTCVSADMGVGNRPSLMGMRKIKKTHSWSKSYLN